LQEQPEFGSLLKVGKKLAPKLDQAMDWAIANIERAVQDGLSTLNSDFEGQYLRQQANLCEEFTTEGFNPDSTIIPLLAEVFVPLDLSGALGISDLAEPSEKRNNRNIGNLRELARLQRDPILQSEDLSIWHLNLV